jgi:hypothetical protein
MAYENDQNEYPLPADGNEAPRKSESLLPRYFRTESNKKFLQSTLDQLTQPGVAEKLNGYVGKKVSKAFSSDDNYIGDVSADRENYQFEPSTIIKDDLDNVTFFKNYNDYINQIRSFGGNVENQDTLNRQEFYSWQPHIDWDKFSNFREYYWLPYGPLTVRIAGQERGIESTLSIGLQNNGDNFTYQFSTDSLVNNPTIILYKGQTYTFDINVPGNPFTIKTKRTLEEEFNFDSGVSEQNVEKGTITFTVGNNVPETLYYVASNDINNSGLIQIKDILENTEIDVEKEIIGKSKYKTESGIELTNGLKISFAGFVSPAEYANGDYYVEGVGSSIQLIKESDLDIPGSYADNKDVPFDVNAFDRLPFSNANGYPSTKDYIVINRSSADKNMWSRYNRWFHKDVIEASAKINNQETSVDQSLRATRPIIEFEPGLKLYQFGTNNKTNVDLIDTFTKDIFSTIEGSIGYSVDGIALVEGMRILFVAEEDIRHSGKIYKVKFILHKGQRQISLIEQDDSNPLENETVLALNGVEYQGRMFYFDGTVWNLTQEKTNVNQQPLFDLFDQNNISYNDTSEYPQSNFAGNKIFSYRVGTGTNDTELGFPLSYRSINNIGDLVFDFNLLADSFTYVPDLDTITLSTSTCILKKYTNRTDFSSVNGWVVANTESSQRVANQYIANNNQTDFEIDVYDNSKDITDLNVKATLNNVLLFEGSNYELVDGSTNKILRLALPCNSNDILVIKTRSGTTKNNNGFYEFPNNLEKNPLNNDVTTFTLGEVNDHVSTIVQEADNFFGVYPGPGNLRDIGNLSQFGRKFLQHSGPTNLALYHLTSKTNNIVKAIDYSRREYAKFKRLFMQTSLEIGYDGTPREHVDLIFKELNKNKNSSLPFYFSDMLSVSGFKKLTYNAIPGNVFYALSNPYSLATVNTKSVNVYINDIQLVHEKDYTFNDEGFCQITVPLVSTDIIDIIEYETTDGCFVPPTLTKLGLYPKFLPTKFVDSTYVEATEMIQGHDGSLVKSYGDYRDDLILELEKRIFNNIKVQYDANIIDIHKFIGGEFRDTNVTRQNIEATMLKDFASWLNVIGNTDYTDYSFYDRNNSFTYNYSFMFSPNGTPLPGYWRAVYKQAYDTDRPHTHPWEMLGFSIKPTWWEEKYGPAPYTSNNDIMWSDLEKGIISVPNTTRIISEQYKRPGLSTHLPVDEQGNLVSPLKSSYSRNYVNSYTRNPFVFGDEAPTETAWRRSSEYPFSLFKSWILNQPSKIIGLGFDRLRVKRNSANQLVYTETSKRIRLEDLVFPNKDLQISANRVTTSGFVNLISNYLSSNTLLNYSQYQQDLKNTKNQMAFKVAGFTDKSKFNLILDSRTPLNEGNVFIPDENYNVILQTSSPLNVITYSGVVIEKNTAGYIIRGYDETNPTFKYYDPINSETDVLVNVGGVSESFLNWTESKRYTDSSIVKYENLFYRCNVAHTSTSTFDGTKFTKLPQLPQVGGRSAFFRANYNTAFVKELAYGTLLRTVQEVVDFLTGYGYYLEQSGFIFDSYNDNIQSIENWKVSAREFMFWSTQNWDSGALITLSPAAQQIQFKSDNSIVDNIFDTFYDYGLVKADGTNLRREFCTISRTNDNLFTLTLKETADGIYAIKLPLVQREHVIILDNETAFKDVIYDPEPGYRQERLRVLGYRTAAWTGSLNIPGFIYDEAKILEWNTWQGYAIGDIVKFKEYYYTAINKITGKENFEANDWYRLDEKPESKLLTNLEYKTNQFADFYDLDSDNFDVTQQEIAQHLIGYQKRSYLSNIINDEVSQYKFYQGMIADKGTRNVLTKLFDALGSQNKESLEFYEEWAVRSGQYGASDGFEELEFLLDEGQYRLNPQPFLLTDSIPEEVTDLIYRQLPSGVFVAPQDYNNTPFPTKYVEDTVINTAGYVREEDVHFVVKNKDDILDLNINDVKRNNYIWVTFEKQDWNVYKHDDTSFRAKIATPTDNANVILTLDKLSNFSEGEILGIYDLEGVEGFHKVVSSRLNEVTITLSGDAVLTQEETDLNCIITRFKSNRVANLNEANSYAENDISPGETIWIDDATNDNKWNVIKADKSYEFTEDLINPDSADQSFGNSLASNDLGSYIAVGAPESNKVHIFKRENDGSTTYGTLQYCQTLEPTENFDFGQSKFGKSVAMSPDGMYLIVGAPEASRVKSAYKDDFNANTDYKLGSIVQYASNLYKSRRSIKGRTDNVVFGTFASTSVWKSELYKLYNNYNDFPVLLTGNYPINDVEVDHILVRAPVDAYEGSNVGDQVYLDWNDNSNAYLPISKIAVQTVDLSGPLRIQTSDIHGLVDSDEIIFTDVPNDNLTFIGDQYDNSDVNVPFNTIEQDGVKGLEDVNYYVKVLGNDYLELYYDSALTSVVNGRIGFTGTPVNQSATAPNGDGFQGNIRKINKPFNNNQPGIDKDFLTDSSHVIRRKVEEVFYVLDPLNIPNVSAGDRVTTPTGNATVVYVKQDLGRLTIYANDKNGTFDTTGTLFVNDLFRVGEYERPFADDVDRSSVLGGYWEIATGFNYTPGNSYNTDSGDGLVITDLKNLYDPADFTAPDASWKESTAQLPYNSSIRNKLANPVAGIVGTDKPFQKEVDLIRVLSHDSQGIAGQGTEEILDNRWIVRLPKNVSDKAAEEILLGNNPKVGVFLNDIRNLDGTLPDISNTGFGSDPYSIINIIETPTDLWDGYIDYNVEDLSFDIAIGDIVREGETGPTAEVTFYQKDLNKARIYVKNADTNFSFGDRYNDPGILFKEVIGSTNIRIGSIDSRQLADTAIGKLAVFTHTENFVKPPKLTYAISSLTDEIADYETQFISGIEYFTWIEEFKPGLSRDTLSPSTANNDWFEVQNIPINVNRDASTIVREGAYFVYQFNSETSSYDLDNGYILPNRQHGRELASNLKIIKENNLYKLIVNSKETHINDGGSGMGRLYFVLNGSYDTTTYDWSFGKNVNFKGNYSNVQDYYQDQIVVYNDIFYKAQTNLQAEEFDPEKWRPMGEEIDFVGYLPNSSGFVYIGDDSSIQNLSTTGYGKVFDISDNGNVLVTIAEYNEQRKLIIYKLNDRHFEISQEIEEPADSRTFGSSIAVSDNGGTIVVGAPNTDGEKSYQGAIYVYKETDNVFSLDQVLSSPNSEVTEGFGATLSFDNNKLIASGVRSDIILDTTYDRHSQRLSSSANDFNSPYVNNINSELSVQETLYDAGFTQFNTRVTDSGAVFVYENINNSLIYGQRLEYKNIDTTNFGSNLIIKKDNILVGLPTLSVNDDITGKVALYTKDENDFIWSVHREPRDQVTIDKFRGSFLYDTKQSEILTRLDIVDPVAGKISGLAEQELSYKTYYDPADYNIGFESIKDQYNTWNSSQVGELWWDLSTVKFVNYYQGSIVYAQSVWNTLAKGASIDVYEWVESKILPSQWDEQADTNLGISKGISGQSKYGDTKYVEKKIYDSISQSFNNRYYFWVKNKKVLPQVENRFKTCNDVENIIRDPQGQQLKFVTILADDRFVLYNCASLVTNNDIALNFRYWTIENQQNNIHSEYQIITDGLDTSIPKSSIEQKWFDSLIGADKYHRPVPDPKLSDKQKYGNLNRPRQSWFVNRVEALKQFIERINRVTETRLLTDEIDITPLIEKDPLPTLVTARFDVAVDTEEELKFVGTVRAETAEITPILEDGQVKSITILNGGRGYKTPPLITITGTGQDLDLTPVLNNLGTITSVTINNPGKNYADGLTLDVRPLSALVNADSTINGAWAIYSWSATDREWSKSEQEYFNVSNYWNYVDWYAPGYSDLTSIDYLVDDFYQLNIIQDTLGSIVKINNVGSGGWILLERVVNTDVADYTIAYKTVGRENGTINFSSRLYTDEGGDVELRKILEAIKNNILVDDLAIEYNNLFFASLRYVFSEQNYVDWAFKTSFIKAKHNVGELIQKTTYQNDNLPSFEEYVNEVKPYKTKIREYLSSYEKLENTSSVVTDFDLAPYYDTGLQKIVAPEVIIQDGVLTDIRFDQDTYPNKNWVDNHTYSVTEIKIKDGGSGFSQTPSVNIIGGGGTGATAEAFIGSGSVKSIVVTNLGSGYTSAPTIQIEGPQEENGKSPKASAIIGDAKTRQFTIQQKFDRISDGKQFLNLSKFEEFVSSGVELKLKLRWPIDLTRSNIKVFFNGTEALSSEYTYNNESANDANSTYDYNIGFIELTQAQAMGTVIRVEYIISYDLLTATDRINILYNPSEGQYGDDTGQLMTGVDYGGVEVRSFEFGQDLGWDSAPWYTTSWDSYDENFEDESFTTDGITTTFRLSKKLETDETYNVYINSTRVDDPNYDGSTKTYLADDGVTVLALGNPNALMSTLTVNSDEYEITVDNNGQPVYNVNIQNVEEWEEFFASSNPTITFRKSTSDGSFLPSGAGFDSLIEGGNLQYGTATGLSSSDINIDGDGFVTPTTSAGPEELIPGQLHDTLDLKVYDRVAEGSSIITTRNYIATATANQVFDIGILPHNDEAVFAKLNGTLLTPTDFTTNFVEKQITLNTPLNVDDRLSITALSNNGERILDIDNFIADGSTQTYNTNVVYAENIAANVTVDGLAAQVAVFDSNGVVGLKFVTAPSENAFISYSLHESTEITEQLYSEVTVDRFVSDGSSVELSLSEAPGNRLPLSHNIVVKIDNKILYPGYTQHWYIESGREYPLDRSQFPVSSLSPDEVDVYVAGTKLVLLNDYRWDFTNTQVVLFDGVGLIGDDLEVFVKKDREYIFSENTRISLANVNGTYIEGETVTIGTDDSNTYSTIVKSYNASNNILVLKGILEGLDLQIDTDNTIPVIGQTSGATSNDILSVDQVEGGDTLILTDTPAVDSLIDIYKFTKHDIQDLQLRTVVNATRSNLIVDSEEYYEFHRLNKGLVKLRQPAIGVEYLWVILNGELLTSSIDYKLVKLDNYIQITRNINVNDTIQVIHFAASKTNEKFGYRVFKDMLNRTHYKRLNQQNVYTLAEPLSITDNTIELTDATGITQPSTELNIPGILFVEGERIEYFTIDNNTLGQLRRGTLGTGPKDLYQVGTELMDQSGKESIPYKDELVSLVKLEDESSLIVLDWLPVNGVDEFEVFVAGRRLRKNAISSYQFQTTDDAGNIDNDVISQKSPDGDVEIPAEFTLTIADDVAIVNLAERPLDSSRVLIVRKIGKVWQLPGEQLRYANNPIAQFIRGATTDLPK